MSKGYSGLFLGTLGALATSGSYNYMQPNDPFSKYIKLRKDIDSNGFYDIIAHGSNDSIFIVNNGKYVAINHRLLAKILKNDKLSKGKAVRLLSCNTGKVSSSFAQNLANKLNVPVKAPTDYLWVLPNGHYFVAGGKTINGIFVADTTKKGRFKTFYPGGKKK